jgi:O-acetyl-ADP-ribose deacetylase (regulator of RNase III)
MQLIHYSKQINLFDHWSPEYQDAFDVDWIIEKLMNDPTLTVYTQRHPAPSGYIEEKEEWVKAMLTLRPAGHHDEFLFRAIDNWCARKNSAKSQTVVANLPISTHHDCGTKLITWQGDITTLHADAIVNAANSQMQGCFQPFHACIDNAIHTAAGPRLREDCHTIIQLQGEDEMTGTAKITRGYNLPSRFVLHTVGPIIHQGAPLTNGDRQALADCYTSCLDLVLQHGDIESVAFCAISTGVFGFPKEEATKIAINTVKAWLSRNTQNIKQVIFNTFDEYTTQLYQRGLAA